MNTSPWSPTSATREPSVPSCFLTASDTPCSRARRTRSQASGRRRLVGEDHRGGSPAEWLEIDGDLGDLGALQPDRALTNPTPSREASSPHIAGMGRLDPSKARIMFVCLSYRLGKLGLLKQAHSQVQAHVCPKLQVKVPAKLSLFSSVL